MMKLYRFEKNNPDRWDTISNNQLWISAPTEFNDLDDCRIHKMLRPPITPEEHDKILKGMDLFYPCRPTSEEGILTKEILEQLKDFISPHMNNGKNIKNELYSAAAFVGLRNAIQRTTGVCCFFSGFTNNALMWAHYADNHKGFCIEYEIEPEETPNLFEIIYASQLPTPSATEFIFSPEETFRRILTTKKMEWNYEKEWRLVYLRALMSGEPGKRIGLPDSIRPRRIITGAKYNLDKKTNESCAADVADKLGIKCLTYHKFKEQV